MTEPKNTQAKRLHAAICAAAGREEADAILEHLPLSASPSEAKKHAWACDSCALLAARFGEQTTREIRKSCRCTPSPPAVKALSELWRASGDMGEFAARATENAKGAFALSEAKGALYITYPQCYCPFIKRCAEEIPFTWCVCTLGYAEELFSRVTKRTVHAVLLESVASGGKVCRIELTFPAEDA